MAEDFTLTLKVARAVIVRTHGPDQIAFTVEGATPFPEMQRDRPNEDYSPTFTVVTRRGYAEEWLQKMGVDPSKVEVVGISV
jgi:hypothetical protein